MLPKMQCGCCAAMTLAELLWLLLARTPVIKVNGQLFLVDSDMQST
jgi:hypothetical protein